jgi:hypothetical protein
MTFKFLAIILILTITPVLLLSDETCDDNIKTLTNFVEINRSLPFKHAVACQLVTDDKFNKSLNYRLKNQYLNRRIEDEEATFKILGIISQDYDYSKCLYLNNSTGTTAYYDEKTNRIVSRKSRKHTRSTIVHELVHALQDQHFKLENYNKFFQSSTDEALTVAALAESEAVRVQNKFDKINKDSSVDLSITTVPEECLFPPLLYDIFSFPYRAGDKYLNITETSYLQTNSLWSPDLIYGTAQLINNWSSQQIKNRIKSKRETINSLDDLNIQAKYKDSLGPIVVDMLFKHNLEGIETEMYNNIIRYFLFDRLYLYTNKDNTSLKWYIYFESTSSKEQIVKVFTKFTQKLTRRRVKIIFDNSILTLEIA